MADEQEPALQGFSSTAESMKHVVKSTVNGAIKGAMIAGAILGALAIVGFVVATPLAAMLTAAASFIPGVGAWIGGSVLNAVIGAAAVGGAVGLGSGVISMDEAVEGRKAELIEQSDRNVMRQRARMVSDMQMAQLKAANVPMMAMGGPSVPSVGMAGQGQDRMV